MCKTSSLPPRSRRRGRPAPQGRGPLSPPATHSSPPDPASPGPAASAEASGLAPGGIRKGEELRLGTLEEFHCFPHHQGSARVPGGSARGRVCGTWSLSISSSAA